LLPKIPRRLRHDRFSPVYPSRRILGRDLLDRKLTTMECS
jgi:hypothetical protein